MKRRHLVVVLGALLSSVALRSSSVARAEDKLQPSPDVLARVDGHIAKGTEGAAVLHAMAAAPAPASLTDGERSACADYSAWVGTVAERISAAVLGLSKARRHYREKPGPALLKEMTLLDEQYVGVVETLRTECEKKAPVPKIMKTKHDTVKNTISNIR